MKTKNYTVYLFLKTTTLSLLFSFCLLAQDKKITFEKYGVTEGLPEEFVSSIVQDDQSFMWFTTQNGLVKFDGYNMKVYKPGKEFNHNPKLQARNLNGIYKAKDGKLWFGSILGDGSYTSFNPVTEKFTTYNISSQNNTSNKSEIMFEDDADNIWLVNSTSNLDSVEVTRLNTKTQVSNSYPHQIFWRKFNDIFLNFNTVLFKADNSVWINDTSGNLMVYNRQQDKFNTVISAGSEIPGSKVSDTIRNIVKGNHDHFLLVGDNSITIWDPVKKSSLKSYTNYSNMDNTFSGNKIGIWAFEDSKGHYWINYENGNILMIDPKTDKKTRLIYGQEPLKFPNAIKNLDGSFPVYQNDHGIWFAIASTSEMGFVYYNHNNESFTYYNDHFNDPKNPMQLDARYIPILQFIEDNTGYKWFGTRPNFYKEAPKNRQIELFTHDPKDKLSIPSDVVNQIFEDSKQRLWIATNRGLSIKQEKNKFKPYYFRNPSGSEVLLGNINEVYEHSKGDIWVCTNGNGLLTFNENKQEFIKFPENIGENILDIEEDKHGNIWVSSDNDNVTIIDGNSAKNY
jgi:ligand-binding sensor domain-containing protein